MENMRSKHREHTELKSELESLKADIESLPDGSDKDAMLVTLSELEQLDRQSAELRRHHSRFTAAVRLDQIFCFLCFCALGLFTFAGIISGKFPNFFIKGMEPAYRADEPFVFWLIATFLGASALCFLLAALRVGRIGRASR
jgi:hypothetical protein